MLQLYPYGVLEVNQPCNVATVPFKLVSWLMTQTSPYTSSYVRSLPNVYGMEHPYSQFGT